MEAALGPVHYALAVPALGPADHLRLQGLLLRAATGPRRGWGSNLAGLLGGSVVGGLGGYLAAAWDLQAGLWVVSTRHAGWNWELDGLGAFLAALGLVAATLLGMALLLRGRQRRALRALHAAGGEIFGAHELLLGEAGLLWRNPSRTLFVPWSRLTGAARKDGMLFLLADRISAFWLPEALLAGHPDRPGIEALLRRHVALP
ncbi:hypothetical protein [Roseomonas sp. BN140053]|uniref:hypothetical protein n=1 Tax=Roseomonas sp. BN140053 TaxID=3391898 RepID=UPI0039EC9AAF